MEEAEVGVVVKITPIVAVVIAAAAVVVVEAAEVVEDGDKILDYL